MVPIFFAPAGDRGPERDAQVRPAVRAAGDGDAANGPVRSRGDRLRAQAPPGIYTRTRMTCLPSVFARLFSRVFCGADGEAASTPRHAAVLEKPSGFDAKLVLRQLCKRRTDPATIRTIQICVVGKLGE